MHSNTTFSTRVSQRLSLDSLDKLCSVGTSDYVVSDHVLFSVFLSPTYSIDHSVSVPQLLADFTQHPLQFYPHSSKLNGLVFSYRYVFPGYMHHCSSILLSVLGHRSCFHILATMNSVALNTIFEIVFLGLSGCQEIESGSYGNSNLTSLEKCPDSFTKWLSQSTCPPAKMKTQPITPHPKLRWHWLF